MKEEIELIHEEVVLKVKNRKEPKLFKGLTFKEFLQAKKLKESETVSSAFLFYQCLKVLNFRVFFVQR